LETRWGPVRTNKVNEWLSWKLQRAGLPQGDAAEARQEHTYAIWSQSGLVVNPVPSNAITRDCVLGTLREIA
jgi:hypothetical protein